MVYCTCVVRYSSGRATNVLKCSKRSWHRHESQRINASRRESLWILCNMFLFVVIRWMSYYRRCNRHLQFVHGPLSRYVKLRVAHAPGMPCRGRFPRHRLQRKPPVSDPAMHHGTCVTHVPRGMSRSLTRGGGENVSGIPGACANLNFTYLAKGPWLPRRRRMMRDDHYLTWDD